MYKVVLKSSFKDLSNAGAPAGFLAVNDCVNVVDLCWENSSDTSGSKENLRPPENCPSPCPPVPVYCILPQRVLSLQYGCSLVLHTG